MKGSSSCRTNSQSLVQWWLGRNWDWWSVCPSTLRRACEEKIEQKPPCRKPHQHATSVCSFGKPIWVPENNFEFLQKKVPIFETIKTQCNVPSSPRNILDLQKMKNSSFLSYNKRADRQQRERTQGGRQLPPLRSLFLIQVAVSQTWLGSIARS